jgi:hypothetical protein
MDVFSNFLVTLDYPMRKLALDRLPTRPEDTASEAPSLKTRDSLADDGAGETVVPPGGGTTLNTVTGMPVPPAHGP